LLRVALLFCGNFAASDDQFHFICVSLLFLVLSRLDYGNATLAGLPANLPLLLGRFLIFDDQTNTAPATSVSL